MLDRIISLLNSFSSERPQLSVPELCQLTGIPRSSVYRLVEALAQHGFCAYDPATRKYRIGPQIIYLAAIALESIELRRIALPYMKKLVDVSGESVNLNIMEGKYRLCIEKVEGSHEIRDISRVGARTPLHAGASGKLLLAYAPEDVIEAYLRNAKLVSLTEQTIVDPDQLRRHLEEIRRQGYATSVGERLLGASSVAAPVFDHSGACVAALTVSGPTFRLHQEVVEKLIPEVITVVQQISLELGAKVPLSRTAT